MTQQQELLPMATGEFLKQKRMGRKLSLSDVAEAVNLDEQLLSDIEQDQAGQVAAVYRNGYIQTYARFLNVSEAEIRDLLSSVASIEEPEIRNIFAEAPRRNPMDRWLRATSYVLASLLIGTLAWQFTHEAVRLSQNGSQLRNTGEVASAAENKANPPQVQELRGPVSASIAPLGALHDKSSVGLDTAEQAWAAVSRPPLVEGESYIQLSVSADSWVEITDADGQQLEMDLLRGGSDASYHGKPPFRILFGRASAVRVSVDDEAIDLTAYTREDVAQLSWPVNLAAENNAQENSGQDNN